jgi:hypothetical protein
LYKENKEEKLENIPHRKKKRRKENKKKKEREKERKKGYNRICWDRYQ